MGRNSPSLFYEPRLRLRTPAVALSLFFLTLAEFAQTVFAVGGSVVAWGSNDYGESNVPANATNIVAVAAGVVHGIALTDRGEIISWGQSSVLPPAGMSNFVAIAAGGLTPSG